VENLNMLTLGAAGAGGSMGLMIFVVIMFVGMYFLSIRPQKKQQQKRQAMLKSMNKGDKVVTLGGIKGTISSINRENKEVVVDCDGIYLTFDLNFIRRSESTADETKKPAEKTESKEATSTETPNYTKDSVETKSDEPKTDDAPEAVEPKAAEDVKDDTKEETK